MNNFKTERTNKRFKVVLFLGLGFLVLVSAVFYYFVYVLLPGKIASSIVDKSKIRLAIHWTPQDDGFKYRDVTFKTGDGIVISGWWMPGKSRKISGTVLLSHGIFKNRGQVLNRAEFLVKAGYQVLLFDQRGEGLSGDSPVSGGVLEARDYLAAVHYLEDKHHLIRPLVFMGFSMGAISAIRAASQYPQVDAVIADSPLPNGKSYVSRRTLGGIFTNLPGFLDVCLKDYDLLTGLNLTAMDLDLTPVVARFNEVPILYITGESDDLARSSEVRELFNETKSYHRALVYVPGAGHEQTYLSAPEAYEQAVIGFLKEVRDHFPEPDQEELLKNAKVIPMEPKESLSKKLESFFLKKDHSTQPIK